MAKEKDAAALEPEIAALLQKIHSNELSGIVRYLHYAHMIFGANRIPTAALTATAGGANLGPARFD